MKSERMQLLPVGTRPHDTPLAAGALKVERERTFFVKSFGCQMNLYDAQRMADVVGHEGYRQAETIEAADLVILNTCHIRERASEKIYSELGKIRETKQLRAQSGRNTAIVVAGCVAQAEGAEIIRRQPAVDLVVGPQNYHRLPDLLRRAQARPGIVDAEFAPEDKFEALPTPAPATVRARGVAAFVTVQEGCDKFCSFCVVPYTRGAEFSRPASKILDEIAHLARSGVREVTLLGQNVNAYLGKEERGDSVDLATLLARAANVPGISRLRYTTSHPNDMSDGLIAAHRDNASLAPYLHLPIQSGSDRVLESMNRRHSVGEYCGLVEKLRAARPDIALSSDFIVGYPSETEAEFERTCELARHVGFAFSYAFKYSARPGTPAADIAPKIDEAAKADRLARLQRVLDERRVAFNDASVGRVFSVLFEKLGRHERQAVGRSPYMQPVCVDGPASLVGAMADVEIVGVGPNSLRGRVVGAPH